ncbi:hypothetical protein [Paenibacillus sp. FSL E2-0178]|uniref:hypothetical protein n=1 Tax=Paenibacillus sp. FSL E2-0178 TaxID=2921361 RepID=UPI0031595B6E
MKYNNFQAQQHEYGEILHFVQHFSFKLNIERRMLYFVQDFWDLPSIESNPSHFTQKGALGECSSSACIYRYWNCASGKS